MMRALFVLLLAGCGAAQTPTATPTATAHLADLAWLTEGPWQTQPDAEGCVSSESWQRRDDTHFTGQSIRVCAGDDSAAHLTEEIVLEERADGIFYVASPESQDRTEFRLTEGDASHFVVENPAHDFPTRIAYDRTDAFHLTAIVSGPERSFTMEMTRAGADPAPQ